MSDTPETSEITARQPFTLTVPLGKPGGSSFVDRAVTAWPTLVPGLCVHEAPGEPGLWNVTHVRSGWRAGSASGPEQAQYVATQVDQAFQVDWTLPAVDIVPRLRKMQREGVNAKNFFADGAWNVAPLGHERSAR